jgi:hypothetical protein
LGTRSNFRIAILTFLLTTTILIGGLSNSALAQTGMEGWSTPINLSRSGAASQPRIVASPTGDLQAFWWDQFEGLVTSVYTNGAWSEPLATSMFGDELTNTPNIVADGTGKIHAFWYGPLNRDTGAPSLLHSWMSFGLTGWSNPDTLEASTAVYELSVPTTGPLGITYISSENRQDSPAGVYFRSANQDGSSFGLDHLVYQSIYFRLIAPQSTSLGLASDKSPIQQIMWHDPNLAETFYALSGDNGFTWSAPELIGEPAQAPNNPRLAATLQYTLRMWQATSLGGCVLYQQRTDSFTSDNPANAGVIDATILEPTWSTQQRIFEGLNFCPQNDQFWTIDQGRQLFWLWGQGSNSLRLTTWDDTLREWSQVANFAFNFEDPETESLISLSDLHATLTDNQMVAIGSDSAGEVWVTASDLNAQELVFAPPAPWTAPARLSADTSIPTNLTSAMDDDSRLYIVWSQANARGAQSLQISRQDTTRDPLNNTGAEGFTAELFSAKAGELIRQPDLLVDERDRLQLVWSGATQGEIHYSWASIQEALSPSGWSTPVTLSAFGLADSPRIGVDLAGILYIVFVVPLNEGRGIYLVRSEDDGQSWSAPQQIMNAAAINWQQIDHLSLAVSSSGELHIAYVDLGIPGSGVSRGVYYQHSPDGGLTWDAPVQLAGAGTDWPELAISNNQVHLVYLGAKGAGAFHRWTPLITSELAESGWSTPFPIPGWQTTIAGYEMTADGRPEVTGTLHLVGSSADIGDLFYNTWDGAKWSSVEAYVPFSSTSLPVEAGVSAATRPEGGELAVSWIARREAEQAPALFYSVRTIAPASVPPAPTPIPTATPELIVNPTVESAATPSPTPILSNTLPPASPIPATLIGGIIATVVVVSIFIWRLIATQRK